MCYCHWDTHLQNMYETIFYTVTRDPQDTNKASRFGHLYNKLTSQVCFIKRKQKGKYDKTPALLNVILN